MEHLSFLQTIVAVIFPIALILLFFKSIFKRRRVVLGNALVTIVPAVVFSYLVFIIKLLFNTIQAQGIHLVGILLLILGTILGEVAFKHIGYTNSDDFWHGRTIPKKRTPVTSGPYGFIRHPLATSMMVSYAGLILIFFHPIPLFTYLLGVVFIVFTSFSEEKFMQKQFLRYIECKKQTGMFLPKV